MRSLGTLSYMVPEYRDTGSVSHTREQEQGSRSDLHYYSGVV